MELNETLEIFNQHLTDDITWCQQQHYQLFSNDLALLLGAIGCCALLANILFYWDGVLAYMDEEWRNRLHIIALNGTVLFVICTAIYLKFYYPV